ncbi:MAG: hypothetical protein AAF611_07170 [Bacteroidota bacterium]
MKKIIFLFTALLTTFSVYCQIDKRADTPEAVGTYTLSVLKSLDHTPAKAFIHKLLTIEELKAYVEKNVSTTESNIKEQINRLTVTQYNERVTDEYKSLKEKATDYNIKWNAIEFVDFEYEKEEQEGFEGVNGKLIFKHNETKYRVKVEAFLIDDKYIPFIIRQLIQRADD